MVNVEKSKAKCERMFTFLRGVCSDGAHPNTSRALGCARDAHANQTRKNGEPYIIHPLSMACSAVAFGLRDDIFLAMILLHDVSEDIGTQIMDLPVDDRVKKAIECMTLRKMPGESKLASKRRYYQHLLDSEFAILGKGLDRRNNLSTMARDGMGIESITKNVWETQFFLLPLLKEAKMIWPEYSNQLHLIREDLTALIDTLIAVYNLEVPDEMPNDEVLSTIIK